MTNEELERRSRELSTEKLELETQKLRKDLGVSPALPLFISAASAVVAGLGLMLSAVVQYEQARFQSQQTQDHEQVDRDAGVRASAEMATETKAGADRRISGVYQLASYWQFASERATIAATLTAVLGAGTAPGYARLRCAAAEGIGMAFNAPTVREPGGPNGDKADADLTRVLYGSSDGQPGLVTTLNNRLLIASKMPAAKRDAVTTTTAGTSGQSDTTTKQIVAPATPGSNRGDDVEAVAPLPTSLGQVTQCTSSIAATIEAIRKNWAHLRGVNLQDTTLRYGEFYAADMANSALMRVDLTGTNLSDANLFGSNLSGAVGYETSTLTNANVAGLRRGSKPFCDYALAHGAIQMSDDDWKRWQASGFKKAFLSSIKPSPTLKACGTP